MTFQSLCSYDHNLKTGQRRVQKCIREILEALNGTFVDDHLGFHLYTPEKIEKDFTPTYAAEFLKLTILTTDGTYVRIQKSGDHQLQKQTYCDHKGYCLFKFLVFTSLTGKIIQVYGPFKSDFWHNDGLLLNHVLENPDEFDLHDFLEKCRTYFKVKRVPILTDRGFPKDFNVWKFGHLVEIKSPTMSSGRRVLTTGDKIELWWGGGGRE